MYTNRLYTVLNFEQLLYSSVLDFRKHPVYKINGHVYLNNLMINVLLCVSIHSAKLSNETIQMMIVLKTILY